VIKKIILLIFMTVILQCAMSSGTAAQTINPCQAITTWYFPDPVPLGWWIYGPGQGPYSYLIAAWKSGCPPPAAPAETCPTCPTAGSPISLATGNTFIKETDISLPGVGGGLSLTRTWNSAWPPTQTASSVGLFGPNWRSTYEERVFMSGDNYLKYARSDGSFWSFGLGANGRFVVAAPANVSANLTQGASYYILAFQNGEQRQFSLTTGLLTAIVDRNGNTTQLTYDSSNRLTTVTDPTSRHLYFGYGGSSYLVSSVTSDFGVSLSYAYDSQSRLSQVTKPDLTTITFAYNAASQISQVTDSNGKVLESHTYDSSGRGLTSSQANGVNALTMTYPQ
jgi:YD repeat-containing protein